MSHNDHYPSGNLSKGDQRHEATAREDQFNYQGPHTQTLSEEEIDEATILGTKIYTAAKRGNRPFAYELVEQTLDAMKPATHSPLLELSLAEVGIDIRVCNSLENAGVFTVGDILKVDRASLMEMKNFGPLSMIGIFAQLASFALNRCMDLELAATKHH